VDGRVVSSDVMRGVFFGFSRIFLLEILIFKGITALRLYKSFGVKGLMQGVSTQLKDAINMDNICVYN
jgi:hypothetical protein